MEKIRSEQYSNDASHTLTALWSKQKVTVLIARGLAVRFPYQMRTASRVAFHMYPHDSLKRAAFLDAAEELLISMSFGQ